MVEEAFKYSATPEDAATGSSAWDAIQTERQVYNHALTQEYKPAPEHEKPSYREMQNKLPEWKQQWPEWSELHSKALQMSVRRIKHAETALNKLKERGFNVGEINWKQPNEYRSTTYNQSGFNVDSNTGTPGHATMWFSKIGTFHLEYHRPLPDNAEIKQVTLKKEKTGDWTVSIVVEYDADYPDKPAVENIDVEDTVGIDLGITKFIHDSTDRAFAPLDETSDRERIERRHRALSRKEHGSRNWTKARRELAKSYKELRDRQKDYREKLASWYTKKYDAVFLEDLNVGSMIQQTGNSRNIASMSWYETIKAFERHGEKNGCHVVLVDPEGTTKQCARCGVETEKPLWVREHSCPSCTFTTDRDHNSGLEIQQRGLDKLGVTYEQSALGLGQSESTPVETGTAVGSRHRDAILASTVAEAGYPNTERSGSPTLNEAVQPAE